MSTPRRFWSPDDLTSALDAPGQHGIDTLEIAGVGARGLAALMDLFILSVPVMIALTGVSIASTSLLSAHWPWLIPALLLFGVLYHTLFELLADGQTPGKNACGIVVISADGLHATSAQIWKRNLWRIIDWLPALYVLGFLASLNDTSRRRLGDRFSGTLVVYEDPLRELLLSCDVPASLYSTAPDGYLLESFLMRIDHFSAEVVLPLAHQLATYFWRKYPPVEDDLRAKYQQGLYIHFLQDLYRAEKEAQAFAAIEARQQELAGEIANEEEKH